MKNEPKILIGNLGKYNKGVLVDEWISLPCTDEELDNLYKRIGINEQYEEIHICDAEDCFIEVGRYENVNALNEMIVACMEFGNEFGNENLIKAVFEHEDVDSVSEAMEVLERIENNYCLHEDIHSYEDYGYYIVDNFYTHEIKEDSFLYGYINFEDIGLTSNLNGEMVLTDYGCLEIRR